MGRVCSAYGGRRKAYTEFWWGNLRKRGRLDDPGVDGRIILRWIFRKWDLEVWTGSGWFRIGTDGNRLASQEGLCFVE